MLLSDSKGICSFFTSLCDADYKDLNAVDGFNVIRFTKNSVIKMQGAKYTSLLMVLKGAAGAEMLDPAGKRIKLETFYPGAFLAPGILFASENRLPVTITADLDCTVLSINKNKLISILMENPGCFEFFISLMGDKIVLLSEKIRLLKFSSLQQKIAGYILNLVKYQKTETVRLPYSREYMADLFGVARPSLSRELSRLVHAEILDIKNKVIKVKKKKALEYILDGKYGRLMDDM